jgi:hypothetical protein
LIAQCRFRLSAIDQLQIGSWPGTLSLARLNGITAQALGEDSVCRRALSGDGRRRRFRAKQGIGGQRVWILGTQAVRRLLQELFEESPSDTLRRVRA